MAFNDDSALVGWLVSFSQHPLGESFEIRAGRSLLSSDPIPGTPFISILYPDVSAPHAVLKASPGRKVMIQDVLSASGTFLTRSGKKRETPISRPTELRNGDVVRFGNQAKFQVCLIDECGR
jgi:pSer/pThr/pTyr-binding forkhead associated (FHA) protein